MLQPVGADPRDHNRNYQYLWGRCRPLSYRFEEFIPVLRVCPSEIIILHGLMPYSTLQKIHAFVRSQVDLGLFRRVLRHSETAALLQDCNAGLQHALDVFGVCAPFGVLPRTL